MILSFGDEWDEIGNINLFFLAFLTEKVLMEYVIEKAYEMGLGGVKILHVQLQSESIKHLNKLKRMVFQYSIDVYCLAIHNDFVEPQSEKEKRAN